MPEDAPAEAPPESAPQPEPEPPLEAPPAPPPEAPPAPPAAAPAPSRGAQFYQRHTKAVWIAGLGLPLLVLVAGLYWRPALFYDHFIWEHLWGSTVADASQTGVAVYHGVRVTDDYTLVAELVYGAILAVSLYGIYAHVIKRYAIKVDSWFVGAIFPFILYGPVTRTLEDTGMFCRGGVTSPCDPSAFAYLFISPFLYAQIAIFVLAFMVAGAQMEKRAWSPNKRLAAMAGLLAVAVVAYAAIWLRARGEFSAMAHPGIVAGSALLGLVVFSYLQRRHARVVDSALLAGGIAFVLPPLWMIARWLSAEGNRWGSTILGSLHTDATPYVLGLPALACLVVFLFGKLGSKVKPELAAYKVPVNLGLVYGHMLDGFASFIAICSNPAGACTGAVVFGLSLPNYGEKHPVSNALLGFGNGWVFPLIKLVLVLAIIWVLDVSYRKDLEKDPNLGGLVRMAILVLGFAPGMRDYLRLAMGT
ncbi:MAG TPA: DUF63 family protein [Candidatus Thermoplasmatota archaeon]|jgi:uncharacterized membrane protein|nr:DUF63 family protein [Candidatus Thermoplasmatota archaeon]